MTDQTVPQEPPITEHPLKRNLWTPDGVHRDGQVVAGEMDKEQEDFLKTTQMVD